MDDLADDLRTGLSSNVLFRPDLGQPMVFVLAHSLGQSEADSLLRSLHVSLRDSPWDKLGANVKDGLGACLNRSRLNMDLKTRLDMALIKSPLSVNLRRSFMDTNTDIQGSLYGSLWLNMADDLDRD